MPIESGGTWYAVPDDFITTTPPTSTTQFWPFDRYTGPKAKWYTGGSSVNLIIGEAPRVFADRDISWVEEIFGTCPTVTNGSFSFCVVRQFQPYDEATNKATMEGLIDDAAPGAIFTWGADEDLGSNYYASSPTGITQYQHVLDTYSGSSDTAASGYRSSFATSIDGYAWLFNATWETDAAAYVADKVANNNWRWLVPQVQWPTVRPMSYYPGGTYFTRLEGYPTDDPQKWIAVEMRHLRLARTAANKMVWVKNLQWNDVRQDATDLNTAKYPSIGFGSNGYTVDVQARNKDTKYTQQWLHFATVDGSDSPASQAEGQSMLGVDLSGDWQVGGLEGLRAWSTFPWYGRYESYPTVPAWQNKPLRLTHILGEASVSATSITSLDEFLSREGVVLASQWELYPESDVGPSVDNVQEPTLELPVEAPPTVKLKLDTLVAPDGGAP